ncbi:aminotransferase class III-fold pyridoxal phosphate-dependent enzyme [Aestuariivita sp.]|jgi:adenosylmethionine-8-amino-7-oxononanoate aminotransferase|uniref:aminotransferase class III-fold pyridoxal phosphate-dependent enzyme n=1 Tax=Aestuariivita sp. TaxID=1872407 RepID=UPI00217330BB|nr:aminotransferase class III-fold pyridoxal phosphate-dependent enzyme [Aestuariivita sp.]MCE8007365.1 aminotransferase class III-fold pyridoxal phosphate-dependent enzyme [Aestuariivita sp.]
MKDDNFLRANNAQHLWHPMGHPGDLRSHAPTIITGAEGSSITDIDGHRTIDAVGGLWCVNLGYSNDTVKEAIAKQLYDLPYYSAFGGTSNPTAIEASYAVREFFAEDGMTRVFFTSGGSDSVETCLRLARQYHRLRAEPGRTKFLSLKKGYHGTHFGGASVNGNNRFRINYEPLMPGCFHLPSPYPYRNPFGEADPAVLAQNIAAAMEDEIAFQGAGSIAAFIMEPIQGAGGVIVPDASFMRLMREICDRHGILMIADEVITGFGRSGDWTGSRHWGVQPDMMCTAKGITSGYFPVGAALMNDKVAEVFENAGEDGGIYHGYTYSAHPVGAAAVTACLSETLRLDTKTNAAARGAQLYEGMLALQEKYDIIGDVRGGHGLMTGVELVSDRAAKTPMDMATMKRIHTATYEAGAMVRLGMHNILMSPPLVITEAEVQQIIDGLDAGFAAA